MALDRVIFMQTKTGIGKVFKGKQFVAEVRYEYRASEQSDEGTTNAGPDKVLAAVTVYLRIIPSLRVTADLLTLHMDDGKKQDFFLTSSNGDCKATGGLY